MDAPVAACNFRQICRLNSARLCAFAVCVLLSGCEGKTLVDDNPVFTAAPPRGSYNNEASLATADPEQANAVISPVSLSRANDVPLTGNTIVAEVNGNPIFVDDLVGSVRLTLEDNPQISDEQRQQILRAQIKGRIDSYVEQEIVLAALNKAVPAEQQEAINASLEEPFADVVNNIKTQKHLETDSELNVALAEEGLSIDLLRESFVRMQKVQGYLSTLSDTPRKIERPEIVDYYKNHVEEFTTEERVRWQEIVVRFDKHGGQDAARKVMTNVLEQLQNGKEFSELATQYSDSLSAEKRGDMGWLTEGCLADQTLEKRLFELKPGSLTKVFVRDDRFEVYHIIEHQMPRTAPLAEVQNEIEQKIIVQKQKAARETSMKKLRDASTVVTIFDGEENVLSPDGLPTR